MPHALFDQSHQDCFRLARGLQEGSRRQPHLRAGKRHGWLAGEDDALAIDRDAGGPESCPRGGELGEQRSRGADALDHDIEALLGLRHGDARFTLAAKQRRERGFELGQAPGDGWAEHRAGGDVDNVVRARAAVTESNAASRAAKREGGAPRLARGTARTSSTGASSPREASAAITCSRFQAR